MFVMLVTACVARLLEVADSLSHVDCSNLRHWKSCRTVISLELHLVTSEL